MRTPVLVSLFLLLVVNSPTGACDCILPKNASVAFDYSNVVFVGTAIRQQESTFPCENTECEDTLSFLRTDNGEIQGRRLHVTFSIKAGWKGVNQPEFTVTLADGSCSYWFDIGREYLVFADAREGVGFVVGMCSRTHPLSPDKKKVLQAERDMAALGPASYIPKARSTPHN